MDQYIGKMLDNRYEILERIGTGGMAVVYKARCHRLNRLVAIKILKPELASDEDFLRRFHDESQAVAMLSHINIVSIYDVCHSDGLDYIVMELIDGMTLKQYMQKRGTPLNWREALHFITQIMRALGHAHSRGIVHRDIKPHNIMVLRDGSVKVADFGIARLTSAAQATMTQEALGSVHYISPEQARGSQVDGRSDIYSAGVVLYEMLTGRLPFEGETPVFVAIQHINSIPIAPRELNPEIPEALEAITMKAMAPNPDQRYSSAEEMLNDLKEFRKNPGMVIATPNQHSELEEVEEPTMVVPIVHESGGGERTRTSREESVRKSQPERQAHRKQEPKRADSGHDEDDEDDRPRRRRGVPPFLVAVLVILLFVGGLVYFMYNFFLKDLFAQPTEYVIPSLVGRTVEDLEKSPLLLNGFTYEVGATVYNEEYAEGMICGQDREAGTTTRDQKTPITVTISGGPDDTYMPDVEGWYAKQALDLLQNQMKMKVTQEYAYSDTITKDYVIAYTPLENTKLEEGDVVTIIISRGPEEIPVTVSNFVGVDIEQAKAQIESLGLTLGKVDQFHSDEYPEGRVIWQSIPPTTEVPTGTTIDLQVSLGPEPVPSEEPSPSPSEEIPVPSADVGNVASTQTVRADLSGYEGAVGVRIIVGNTVLFDGTVESSTGSVTREITGTGTQLVTIYINGDLVESYYLEF